MASPTLEPLDRVPFVLVHQADVPALRMDHRAGFVLSRVDGASSLETILDVCGMPRADALRVLRELIVMGAIGLRG